MGRGKLSLKGIHKTPWLEIRRCETERTYLDHQLRTLRKLSQGEPCRGEIQLAKSEGFYDQLVLRFHSRLLYRAWDLLYPRDQRLIGQQALLVAGAIGAASLWIDNGRWDGRTGVITGIGGAEDSLAVAQWLVEMNVPCRFELGPGGRAAIFLGVTGMSQFVKLTRPVTHVSMRHRLKPPKEKSKEDS